MPKFKTNTIRTVLEALLQDAKPYSTKQNPRYSDRLLVAGYELTDEGHITFTADDIIEKVKEQHEKLTDSTNLGKRMSSCIRKLMNSMRENGYLHYNESFDEYQMTVEALEMMQEVKDKLNAIPLYQISTTTKRYYAYCSLVNGRTGTFQIRKLNLRQMNEAYVVLEDKIATHVCPDPRMPGAWPDDDRNSASNADDASESNVDTDGASADAEMEGPDEGVNPPPAGQTHSISTPPRPKRPRDPALAYPSPPDSNRRSRGRDQPPPDSPSSPTLGSVSGSNNSGSCPMNIDESLAPTVSKYANMSQLKALTCHQETVAALLSITTPDPPLEVIEETLQARLLQLPQKDAEIQKLQGELDSARERLGQLEHQKRQIEEKQARLERAERELEDAVTERGVREAQWQTEMALIYDEKEVLRQLRDEALTELAELRQQMEITAQNMLAAVRGRA